ncbi:unnamed protein product [Clonostachys chloroleuca]|uniref:BZIP domain-containing protein n=1 Tax=Clonostachys chloroleuca TaxID=1926264 RepID=A0AA35LY87_9HYPO|nr:unnamed protein product [Clonostachys chloroleuca]
MEATQEADSIRERKERKKLQNRLNQRARRSRLKEDKTDKKTDRPYEVDRWRLHYSNGEATEKKQQQLAVRKARPDADDEPQARMGASPIFGPFVDPVDVGVCICSGRAAIIKTYSSSVSADHLLELIQFNVFRALVANKHSMTGKAQHYQEAAAQDGSPLVPYLEQTYPGNAVLVPLSAGELPVSLLPTQLQITVRHATWIDLLPFPRMRDNLIRAQHQFDHAELVNDVIGQLIDLSRFFRPEGHLLDKGSQAPSGGGGSPEAFEDEATAPPRGGFIVYGAPHRVESWEVTPEFVWKWGWTLMGCQELMESTNRWRRSRGEAALPMIITRPWHNNSLGLAGMRA